MTETVWLQRPSADVPWGFRLHGGRDYQEPLCVQRVSGGVILGAVDGVLAGDGGAGPGPPASGNRWGPGPPASGHRWGAAAASCTRLAQYVLGTEVDTLHRVYVIM